MALCLCRAEPRALPWVREWGSPLSAAAWGPPSPVMVWGTELPQHGDTSLLSHMQRAAPPRCGRTDRGCQTQQHGEGRGGGSKLMVTCRDRTREGMWEGKDRDRRTENKTVPSSASALQKGSMHMQTETGVRNNRTWQCRHAAQGCRPAETHQAQALPCHTRVEPAPSRGNGAVRQSDPVWGPFPWDPQPYHGHRWGAAQLCPGTREPLADPAPHEQQGAKEMGTGAAEKALSTPSAHEMWGAPGAAQSCGWDAHSKQDAGMLPRPRFGVPSLSRPPQKGFGASGASQHSGCSGSLLPSSALQHPRASVAPHCVLALQQHPKPTFQTQNQHRVAPPGADPPPTPALITGSVCQQLCGEEERERCYTRDGGDTTPQLPRPHSGPWPPSVADTSPGSGAARFPLAGGTIPTEGSKPGAPEYLGYRALSKNTAPKHASRAWPSWGSVYKVPRCW